MESAGVRSWRCCIRSAFLAAIFLAGANSSEVNCTSPNGQDGSFVIASQADADSLSNCSTISSNVVIQSNDLTQITLNGIEIIQGNLTTSSCNSLQNISAPILAQIAENFTLSSLPRLTSLEFPLLDNVQGGIYWDTLPDLTDVSFGNMTANPHDLPGANVDGDIVISNTALSSLAFLNFTHYSEPDMIWITGNQQLNTVNLTGMSWGSNSLAIINNGPSAQIVLPNLRSVGAITISNAGYIDIPSLSQTIASLEISNNSLDAFDAPSLTVIGGNFTIRNNYLLKNLNLPLLTTIGNGPSAGDFVVENNTALNMITNMAQLGEAHGNVTLSGNLADVELPDLRSVIGGFHLNSSNTVLDCTAFDKVADESGWNSSFYSCGAYVPGETKDVAKHYQASGGGLQISKSARAIIIIVSIVAGILLCALLMRWCGRRRARRGGNTNPEEAVDLGDVGVVRSDSNPLSEGEILPKYRKVGKPGEVPPGYAENGNQGAHQAEARNVTIAMD